MIKIKEIMRNEGFDYDNPEGLEGSDFHYALLDYKSNFGELEEIDPEERSTESINSLEMQEQNLLQIFNETVISEEDPEIEELKQKELQAANRAKAAEEEAERIRIEREEEREQYEAEAAEAKRISDIREEKLNSIEDKQKLIEEEKIFLLNNKRKLTYSELEKVGINIDEAPRKFEWNGYVFEKQWMFKQYVILSRPK